MEGQEHLGIFHEVGGKMLPQNPGGQEMKSGQREEMCLMAPQGPFDNLPLGWKPQENAHSPIFLFPNDPNGFTNPEGPRGTPETVLAPIHV